MQVTTEYYYVGNTFQVIRVPNNVTDIFWELYGASGGYTNGNYNSSTGAVSGDTGPYATNVQADAASATKYDNKRSLVGYVSGTMHVLPGSVIYLVVGGSGGPGGFAGQNITNQKVNYGDYGVNGGGYGGEFYAYQGSYSSTMYYIHTGAGGGGATDIRYNGSTIDDRVLVAGGGGGEGGSNYKADDNSVVANPTTPNPPYTTYDNTNPAYYASSGNALGGYGGGTTGGSGGHSAGEYDAVATGGSQTAGGDGTANPGSFGSGGEGVSTTGGQQVTCGGGGGGGYYGGAGGGAGMSYDQYTPQSGGGGGGGSNYISSTITDGQQYAHVWRSSPNGLAIAKYRQPPDAPYITSPVAGNVGANAAITVNFSYQSSVAGSTQSSFDIRYQVENASTWNTIGQPGSNANSYTLPASDFVSGNSYVIEVRTYDQEGDVSPWSSVTISITDQPATPIITSPTPGQILTSGEFTLIWKIQDGLTQNSYNIELDYASVTTNIGNTKSAATTRTITGLSNGPLSVRVMYDTTSSPGVFSEFASVSFDINTNPPDAPTVIIQNASYAGAKAGTVCITIQNPETNSNGSLTNHNEVYRTNMLTGVEEQVGFLLTPSTYGSDFYDYSVASNVPYKYRIRAVSVTPDPNGGSNAQPGGYVDVT